MGYLPFMPGAMQLRAREEWAECNEVKYYELDEADLDRACARFARDQARGDRFVWFWFRPDVRPRGERFVWRPGLPCVQPPRAHELLTLNHRRFRVQAAARLRADNFGWAVLREVH